MRSNEATHFDVGRRGIAQGLVDGLVKMIARYRKYRELQADIAALRGMSDRDLKDIGVSRSDIDRAAGEERFPIRLP